MADWLAWLCMGAAFVAAFYLMFVILKPERF
ncbi:MAG: potassium-transporting ATPase subunit F [Xanthomonadales bacterium]|nr:potassium-transporting ATPase subunit F [Xanthomonadales bacterium]